MNITGGCNQAGFTLGSISICNKTVRFVDSSSLEESGTVLGNMRSTIWTITQVLLLIFVTGALARLKRSPLEVGLVAFTEKPHHTIAINGTAIAHVIKPSHSHKWIPGHVRHHSYIPAHLDHLYLPTQALLLARTVETIFVDPDLYRQHYGGFGIGVDMGGHGAGHGFHVVFNF